MKNLTWTTVMALLVLLGCGWVCLADTIVTSTGRTLTGEILQRYDDGSVVMQLEYGTVRIAGSNIESIKPGGSPPAGKPVVPVNEAHQPVCYLLTLKGIIGIDVTAEALARAWTMRPNVRSTIILDIDSPGGSVEEMVRIVEFISEHNDERVVAYVRKATSAAAVVTMACREIVMAEDALLGAVVPYRLGPEGTPKVIEEKLQSIIRAQARRAAETGGHDPLIMRGMMEPDLELTLVQEDGKLRVRAGRHAGRLLKARGKLLTLTARQTVDCGLARGIAASPVEVHAVLGLAGSTSTDWPGNTFMLAAAQRGRAAFERRERQKRHAEHVKHVAPELREIEGALARVQAAYRTATETERHLKQQHAAEISAARRAHAAESNMAERAKRYRTHYSATLIQQATRRFNSRVTSINGRYQYQFITLKERISRLEQQRDQLQKAKRKLLAGPQ